MLGISLFFLIGRILEIVGNGIFINIIILFNS